MSESEQKQQEGVQESVAAAGVSLLDEIVEASKLKPSDDGYAITKAGFQAFIEQLAGAQGEQKISGALVDE